MVDEIFGIDDVTIHDQFHVDGRGHIAIRTGELDFQVVFPGLQPVGDVLGEVDGEDAVIDVFDDHIEDAEDLPTPGNT